MGDTSTSSCSSGIMDLSYISTAISESINGVGMSVECYNNNVIQSEAAICYEEQLQTTFDQTQLPVIIPDNTNQTSTPTDITGLKSYLLGDFDGLTILKTYETVGLLTPRLRKTLVHKVIKREEEILFSKRTSEKEILTFTISSERFQDLTSDIVSLFVGESRGAYFIPFKTIKKDGVSCRANQCGKLYDHFCYRRNLLIDAGFIAPQKKFKPILNYTSASIRAATVNENAKLDYIIKTIEPTSQLYDYWKETFQFRRAEFQQEKTDIPALFKKYRCLQMEFGAELLKIDFDFLIPDKSNIFLYRWPLIRHRIVELFYGLRKPKKAVHCELVRELSHLAPDEQDAIVLHLLPTLIKPKNLGRTIKAVREEVVSEVPSKKRKTSGKGSEKVPHQKASESEAQDAFFLVVSTVAGIEEAVKKRKADLHKRQLSIQVLPVFVGTLEKIDSSYVYIDTNIKFREHSPMHAIDLAFKIFYALDCSYPLDAAHVWLFIQHVGFVIEDPAEKLSASAEILKGEVELVFQSGNSSII